MAMGIKWRTSLMSINNTKYIVDIYKDGWTGSVTELTPATDALTIEEYDDSDLLSVIRYKTGYVSVMAYDDTDVSDIFPTGVLERPVTVTEVIGNTQNVIFYGYVQVQEFNRFGNYADTGNPPQTVQIPIISPLGLINDIEFDKVTTPQDYTLFAVIKNALNKIRPNNPYQYIYCPDIIYSQQWAGTILKVLRTSSLVINPLSTENIHTQSLTADDCFTTTSVGYFIEGICRCFGFMVHETADSIVFTRVDAIDSYVRYTVDSGAESTVSSPSDFTLAPTSVMADGIDITQIAPLRRLTCNFDGDRDTELRMSFQHCARYRGTNLFNNDFIVVNSPRLTTEWEVPYLSTTCNIGADSGRPETNAVRLIAMGSDSLQEMILVNYREQYGHTWATGDVIAKYNFYGYFGTDMTMNLDFKWGGNINLESEAVIEGVERYITITIRNGNKYYNVSTGEWQSPNTSSKITLNDIVFSKGHLSISIPTAGMETIPIEVTFQEGNMRDASPLMLLAITNISLSGKGTDAAERYINEGTNPGEYVLNGEGIDDEDISIPFACYGQTNSHTLFPNITFNAPQYPYMFNRRQQVRVTFRGRIQETVDYLLYMRTVVWKGTAMRLISANYSADSELTTIILQTI